MNRDRTSPGYWFVAPYGQMQPEYPTHRYEPYQIGPYIYDSDGILVWAGSHMFDNRNIFDFRAVHSMNGGPHLSLVWQHAWDTSDLGYGVILKNNYEIDKKITYEGRDLGAFDIHEFNVLADGKTALSLAYREHTTYLDYFGHPELYTSLLSGGFTEIDVKSGKVLNDWDTYDQIGLDETVQYNANSPPEGKPGWDYVHANSVDRNEAGDYIMSMRFTNTIYFLDGDGRIKWRLGGKNSDFKQDFTFSKQHDAKFLESNGTHHVISILNNASDEFSNDENISSALVVEVDTAAMTARVIERYNRPDGGLTRLRGNAQKLPNGNMFVGWSEWGYISEHTPDGEVLYEAHFPAHRFSTYRAYKFEFTGRPSSPPTVVSSVSGTDAMHLITTFYVSWNGATDIASWNFYARHSANGHSTLVGNVTKRDFETMFISRGYLDWVQVEAVDHDGNILGTSPVQRTSTPDNWEAVGFQGNVAQLKPDNPAVVSFKLDSNPKPATEKTGAGSQPDSTKASTMRIVGAQREVLRVANETLAAVKRISGIFALGLIVCLVGGSLACVYTCLRRRKTKQRQTYQKVPREEDGPEEEMYAIRSAGPVE